MDAAFPAARVKIPDLRDGSTGARRQRRYAPLQSPKGSRRRGRRRGGAARPVFVLGHSFGAVCAFEAAFGTPKIARLALYEPPVRLADHSAILARMEAMIRSGDRTAGR